MLKNYQIQNILPLIFSISSFYLLIKYWTFSFDFILEIIIVFVGLIIWWAGKLTLGDSFSVIPKAKKLIVRGIYSKVRHPIYIGISLTLIGWSLIIKSLIVIIITILIILFLIIRAYFEEKVLYKKFGRKYKTYKNKSLF